MTPEEIIRKQAAAVTGFNKMTMADHYEAIAKMLRQEAKEDSAKQGVKQAFAAGRAKKARADRFAAAMQEMKEEQIVQAFAGSDWVKMKEGNGITTYCRKGRGHLYINIKGNQYSITEGENTGRYTSVNSLGAFIAAEKKNRK